MTGPLLTVVVPTIPGRESLLSRCLFSIQEQAPGRGNSQQPHRKGTHMIKFARTTASVGYNGRLIRVVEDDAWLADDAFVRTHPELFGDSPRNLFTADGRVEQATAAPGERRTSKRG
jgi:hypothetical protein